MFGLGKVFSGFFESIGLGWMGNVLSLATNFMMGNWVGVAEDIFRLVSEFSNNSWQNKVDRFQPLGAFGQSSCFGDNSSLSESRISDLRDRAESGGGELPVAYMAALDQASSTIRLRYEVDVNRRNAYATASI
jgi:hypothetical protein